MATKKAVKRSKTKAKALPAYTNEPPAGAWPVGTEIKVVAEGRGKVKRGMIGHIFGYRPGRESFLYYARLTNGAGTPASPPSALCLSCGI